MVGIEAVIHITYYVRLRHLKGRKKMVVIGLGISDMILAEVEDLVFDFGVEEDVRAMLVDWVTIF